MKIEEMRCNSNVALTPKCKSLCDAGERVYAASGTSGGNVPVLSRKKLQRVSLSDDCKSIIYGTLLGDGCLQKTKGYKNARLSIRHSSVQVEYFNWKANRLEEIASPKSVQKQAPKETKSTTERKLARRSRRGLSNQTKFFFQSRACSELSEIHSITHLKNRLHIQRRWCNHLTPLSLAVWWCDDGSIIGNGRKGVLCTDGFDETSVRLLANYLQTVWGIHVHVGAIKRDRKYGNYTKSHYYRLWFGTEELKKWLRIIMPHLPVASMLYKVVIVYKDSLFQERWISELKLALPHFENQIDEFMYNLKQKQAAKMKASTRSLSGGNSENDIVQKTKELQILEKV